MLEPHNGIATGYARKPALVALKGAFYRCVVNIKSPKYLSSELAFGNHYNATKAGFSTYPVVIPCTQASMRFHRLE